MHQFLITAIAGLLLLQSTGGEAEAAVISVPNASFEVPSVSFPTPNFNSWQKSPKPDWYDEGNGAFLWTQLTGVFKNPAVTSTNDHIDNCDGLQAIWMFAVPEVGLFQDYESMDWNDSSPSHEFDAHYEPGKSYDLIVGVIGTGGGMVEGVTMELGLYYRDAASNRVAVATTILTNNPAVFSNNTHFVDCHVNVPVVKVGDPWAAQRIGIQFVSTVTTNLQGGYWDLDNVRLASQLAPVFVNPGHSNVQFECIIQSEPGLVFELFASTNLTLPALNWTSLGVVTNVTGAIPFIDTSANFDQRYYQARQLP